VGTQVRTAVFPLTHPAGNVDQAYVYPPEPPATVDESVTDCPSSRVDLETATVGADSAGETTTVVVPEVTVYPFESVRLVEMV
jgi:hypothetical protein